MLLLQPVSCDVVGRCIKKVYDTWYDFLKFVFKVKFDLRH